MHGWVPAGSQHPGFLPMPSAGLCSWGLPTLNRVDLQRTSRFCWERESNLPLHIVRTPGATAGTASMTRMSFSLLLLVSPSVHGSGPGLSPGPGGLWRPLCHLPGGRPWLSAPFVPEGGSQFCSLTGCRDSLVSYLLPGSSPLKVHILTARRVCVCVNCKINNS